MIGRKSWLVVALVAIGLNTVADACTVPLPQPPLWVLEGGNDDEFLIGVELDSLFDPSGATTCACGLQFSSPLPFGSDVTDAFVAVTNLTTHAMTLVPGFTFTPNSNTENGLESRTEQDWYGLATSAISSITQPTVGPNEALKLWYRVTIGDIPQSLNDGVAALHVPFDPNAAFSTANLTFATGSAQPDGTPNFAGDHPVEFFTAVPEPATLLLAMFAGLGLAGRTRR